MTTVAGIEPPFPVFTDREGNPLEDGYVYIGTVNTNPLIAGNQLAIYADSALTIPMAQPVRTSGGVMVRSGTPATVYVPGVGYSIVILDKNGSLVYSSLNAPLNPQTLSVDWTNIVYDQTAAELAAGKVPVNYYYGTRPFVDAARFGVVANGVADDTVPLQNAIASLNGRGTVWWRGTAKVTGQIVMPTGVKLLGDGYSENDGTGAANRGATCILRAFAGASPTVLVSGDDCAVDNIDFDNDRQGTGEAIQVTGSRFTFGTFSARNSGGDSNFRIGLTEAGAASTNANGWSGHKVIVTGGVRHGFRIDSTNTTVSASYPLGITDCNAAWCDLVDARNNGSDYNISAITKAVSAVVTISTVSASHPIPVGETVSFQNIVGMTELNTGNTLRQCVVKAVGGVSGAWTVTLNVDSTTFGAYVSGGTMGLGDGVQIGNANDIGFGCIASQFNHACGIHFKTTSLDGGVTYNAGPRCNKVMVNDSEANIGNDVQIDQATIPASGPGLYNVIWGNRSVAVNSRISDLSGGSLVMQWVPGLAYRGYHFGTDLNTVNNAGQAGYNMYVGANNAVARIYAVASGAVDTILRGRVRKSGGGETDAWEANQNAVFNALNNYIAIAFGANIVTDAATGHIFQVNANSGVAFNVNAPTNLTVGESYGFLFRNTSGGALGAATWNAIFKMSAWTSPANGFSRYIEFFYNGANLIQKDQAVVDVPN